MKSIVTDEPLMSYSVSFSKKDGYKVAVKAHGKTVNSWDLGHNEEIAQSRVKHLVDTYLQGLEFVQDQVRTIFADAEEKAKE